MKEYIDKFLKKFSEKGIVCDENSEIFKKVQDCLVSQLSPYILKAISRVNESNDKFHYVALIVGGDNGNGKWSDYLNNLKNLFKKFERTFKSTYVINVECDCADDVHYILIGIYQE